MRVQFLALLLLLVPCTHFFGYRYSEESLAAKFKFERPNKPIISYLTSNALYLYSAKGEHFHLHLEPLEITSRSPRSLSPESTTLK